MAGQAEGAAGVVDPQQARIVLLVVHVVAGGAFEFTVEQQVVGDGSAERRHACRRIVQAAVGIGE